MALKTLVRKWWIVPLACAATAFVVRFSVSPARADESEPYRVEIVQNDQYKVQVGLNSLAGEGWTFVTAIDRNDGKVLLVFHKESD